MAAVSGGGAPVQIGVGLAAAGPKDSLINSHREVAYVVGYMVVSKDASNQFVHSMDGWLLFGTVVVEPSGAELKKAHPDGIKPCRLLCAGDKRAWSGRLEQVDIVLTEWEL